jgi:oxygen-independent coproporphyrinogen-3 oxidase
MTPLAELLTQTPYVAYTYAYPHKTAYRPFAAPIPLQTLWAAEERDALFLYLHVPFCEMRCGFCNLFTTTHPSDSLEAAYLTALERQARVVREAVGPATIARLAIGGGTPTYLEAADLHRLFDLAEQQFQAALNAIPISVETSPKTATVERLGVLRERGVDRVSIGVQSFVEAEVAAAGRSQQTAEVEQALERIRAAGFPTLNIDLIYGLPGQTVNSWLASLEKALCFAPEELYLYPLYVRPLTGLDGRNGPVADVRLECYRAGREFLLAAGYEQLSMRFFRAKGAPAGEGPLYCCQEDGMIGLGCGARSYTRACHYSGEYAVGRTGIRAIIADYLAQPETVLATAVHGYRLDKEEQRRRYLLKSLLRVEGLALADYQAYLGTAATEDWPQLAELVEHGLAVNGNGRLQLTAAGLERSDMIGPWFYSQRVQQLTAEYELR